jgi:hypothetical protein
MLDRNFEKTNFSDEISELKEKAKLLQYLGRVSSDISFYFQVKENIDKCELVNSIARMSDFVKSRNLKSELEVVFYLNKLTSIQNKDVWRFLKELLQRQPKEIKDIIDIYVCTKNETKSENIEEESIEFISIFFKRENDKFVNQTRYTISNIVA